VSASSKQLAKLFIRILITSGLLLWVFSQDDIKGQFWAAVEAARWQFLFAVWGLTILFFLINSIKLKFILKKQGCEVDIPTIFGASAVTSLYSMIIPGMLSTGAKWYILKKNTGNGSSVLSSMLYNQLSIMVVMAMIALAALIVTNPTSLVLTNTKNQWLLPVVCSVLLAAIMLISFLLLNNRTGGKIIDAFRVLLGPFPARIRNKGLVFLDQISVFQTVGVGFHLTVASFTAIAGLVVGVLIYILAARAANVTAPLGVFVWLCALIYVLGRMPISLANLGVREVTLVGVLSIYGVEKSQALLMSMIVFSTIIVMAVIGAIYQILWAVTAKKSAQSQGKSAP
jgi:uncharacterized membrane protein YbhN (UPF0104 family)